MPKRHGDLFDQIVDMNNLREAYKKTSKGKKATVGYLRFKEYAEANLLQIQQELVTGEYKMKPSRKFIVHEPKKRAIDALEFRDRLVQHALCNIIEPIFENTFLPNSYACREGKGTHGGVKFIQSKLRREQYPYFLKTDFRKYFPSIVIKRLMKEYESKVKCQRTLALLKLLLGDGTGVKIGWLISQLSANVYGNILDKFLYYELGLRDWARYMDDVIILGDSMDGLRNIHKDVEKFSSEEMQMTLSRWEVSSVRRGINFLGYRIWRDYKLIRKDSVKRARQKIKRYTAINDIEALRKFKASWSGHIKWSNAHNLKTTLGLEAL